MKKMFLIMGLAGTLALPGLTGCATNSGVPANRITLQTPQGRYDINTPKNVDINNFAAAIASNSTVRITFDKWKSVNDPAVIDKAAAGQVAIINAWRSLISDGIKAGVEAAASKIVPVP